MLSPHPKNIFTSVLSLLRVKHTHSYSNKIYNEHPHKYNMFGISKMLSDYNIENVGLRIENKENDIYELDPPFIAHIGTEFVAVDLVTRDKVRYKWNQKSIEMAVNEFVNIWTGITLITSTNRSSIEPNYKEHRRTELFNQLQKWGLVTVFIIFIILAYISNNLFINIGITLGILVNLIGICTCFLLVQKQINIHNEYTDKICSLFKQSDCNNILESDAAKLWNVFGWSEVGLGYFISNTTILLLFPQLLFYLTLINICTLPYSFWSIWYQKIRAKQWCPLCIVVQILLWAQFLIYVLSNNIQIPDITISNLLLIGCIYTIPFLIINIGIPSLSKGAKMEQITQEINSIKATKEVFTTVLRNQTHYIVSKETSDILWGNSESQILVTILTNPHCAPCAKMHARIEEILKEKNICVQYIFSSFEEKLDSSNKFLIATYLQKEEALTIFNEWFKGGNMNKDSFFLKYNIDIEDPLVKMQFEKHIKWKNETALSSTPTILVNGYKLPDNYKIEDLKYFSTLDL